MTPLVCTLNFQVWSVPLIWENRSLIMSQWFSSKGFLNPPKLRVDIQTSACQRESIWCMLDSPWTLEGKQNLLRNQENPFERKQKGGFVLGRTGFSRIFIFGPPDFSRILQPDFFSSSLWEKQPWRILQENPRQSPPNFTQQKSPTLFCRWARPKRAVL